MSVSRYDYVVLSAGTGGVVCVRCGQSADYWYDPGPVCGKCTYEAQLTRAVTEAIRRGLVDPGGTPACAHVWRCQQCGATMEVRHE